jgi:hypothetical protein
MPYPIRLVARAAATAFSYILGKHVVQHQLPTLSSTAVVGDGCERRAGRSLPAMKLETHVATGGSDDQPSPCSAVNTTQLLSTPRMRRLPEWVNCVVSQAQWTRYRRAIDAGSELGHALTMRLEPAENVVFSMGNVRSPPVASVAGNWRCDAGLLASAIAGRCGLVLSMGRRFCPGAGMRVYCRCRTEA